MDQHRSFGLDGRHQHNRDQIRRKPGPGCIINGENRTVYQLADLVVFLCRHINIIAPELHDYPQFFKYIGNDPQFGDPAVFNGDL
ncbi:hypothetical protein D9M69_623930 [compost metagenome]